MIYLDFNFNILNIIFSIVVIIIRFFVKIYSKFYFSFKINFKYKINLIIFIISILLLINRNNLISIIIGWDGLGISSFFLVSYYFNLESCISSIVTFFFNRLGDRFILIFCRFITLYNSKINLIIFNYLIFFILFIGLITKSSQIPFGVWLPLAISAPTPISSLVHSSTLVTAGIFIIIKLNFIFYLIEVQLIILIFGIFTFLLGGLFSLCIMDLKKAVAFSTLSQLGFIIIRLRIGNYLISFYHLLFHALFKSSLFINLGIFISYSFSNQDKRFIKTSSSNKIIYLTYFICCLNLIGLISFCGFFSKDLILIFFFNNIIKILIKILIYLGCILTGSYSLKFLLFLFNEKLVFSKINFNINNNLFIIGPLTFSILIVLIPIIFIELFLIDMDNFIFLNSKIEFYLILIFSILIKKIFLLNLLIIIFFSNISIILDYINFFLNKIKFLFYYINKFMIIEEFIQLNLIKILFKNKIIFNFIIKFNIILILIIIF